MTFEIVQDFTDYEVLKDVEDDAGERYRELGYLPDEWPTTPAEAFATGIEQGLLWVATTGQPPRACGFALAQQFGDYLHLDELDVLCNCQGNGIGRSLVQHVIAEAKRRKCTVVTLRMFKKAAWSRGLYESLGFVEIRDVPDYIAHYHDEETSEGLPSEDFCTLRLRL